MSHKLTLKTTVETGETGIDTVQHAYNSGSGFTDKAKMTFTSSGDIAFKTPSSSSSVKMFVANNGNVGIGTTSPSVKLHVAGAAKFDSLQTTSLTTTSDRRKKTNIEMLKSFDLDKLRPVQYKWKREPDGKRCFGFIAQEIEMIYPNIIRKDDYGFYSMDYLQLIPVSIKNLQIQDNCIKELREDIEFMKKELQKLKDYADLEYITSSSPSSSSPSTSYNSGSISSEDFDNW
tara:strand:- start:49 stop:744 length:696 start_codon:yes stop_codon:yes gene_type:complete